MNSLPDRTGLMTYLDFAERLARNAGALLLAAVGRVPAREKGPSDLVTDADLASQRAIAAAIRRTFPDHTLLAEEEGVVADPERPWRWIVDPLDGTINFAHGLPLWCVSIALEHAGELMVGVVHVPPLGSTFRAARGHGATCDGRPLRVSTVASLRDSLIATGLPPDFAADADRQMALMRRFSTGTHSLRRTGTTAWNLAQVATGAIDVFYATAVHAWDVAAGVLLVREAGGHVTRLNGGPYRLDHPDILATNGHTHAEALRAVGEAWPDLCNGPIPEG
jgi:myo-inositol-1(or 4)-monophosphatase